MARRAVESWAEERWHQNSRRISRAVAAFSVHHMNDTKWREVLTLLQAPDCKVERIRLKFVDGEHVNEGGGRFYLMERVCDDGSGPIEYREIQWLEVPERYFEQRGNAGTPAIECRQDVEGFKKAVESLGRLPIRETGNGFRIVGYE